MQYLSGPTNWFIFIGKEYEQTAHRREILNGQQVMFKLILRKMQINENLVPHFTYDIGKKIEL